ncbi:hypothetical protein ACYU0V_13225 [Acinetobacter sp. X9]
MNIPENFDLVKTIARRDKLRDRYYRGGLSNADYKELIQLDKEIGQAFEDLKK